MDGINYFVQVESSGQLPTTANADAVNNANASEKVSIQLFEHENLTLFFQTFVQQLGDCAGVEAETENDGVEQHAKVSAQLRFGIGTCFLLGKKDYRIGNVGSDSTPSLSNILNSRCNAQLLLKT